MKFFQQCEECIRIPVNITCYSGRVLSCREEMRPSFVCCCKLIPDIELTALTFDIVLPSIITLSIVEYNNMAKVVKCLTRHV